MRVSKTKIQFTLQGDSSGRLKPPVDLVLTVLAAGGLLLQLPMPTALAGKRNIPNTSQREVCVTL